MLNSKGFDLWANVKRKILIGDISFETSKGLDECKEIYKEIWDNEEFYFTANAMMKDLNQLYYCNYKKISYCSGVLTVANSTS